MTSLKPGADLDDALSSIEHKILNAVGTSELANSLKAIEERMDADPIRRLRFLVARGTLENRQARYSVAEATALEARHLAAAPHAAQHRSRISRLLATIHAWRGKGETAMRELMRAVAEARIVGDEQEVVVALADGVRACKEMRSWELGLVFLDAVLASPLLTGTMRARSLVDRLQVLNRLERHGDCIAAIEECAAEIVGSNSRLRLLTQLERARACAGASDIDAARAVIAEARELLPADTTRYEHTEWAEASYAVEKAAEVQRGRTQEELKGDRANLEQLVKKAHRDGLHEKEAEGRLDLAALHHSLGDVALALEQASEAMHIGSRQNSAHLRERALSAMVAFGVAYGSDGAATGVVSNRYVIGAILGRGGYGIVKHAYDRATGEHRALKFIDLHEVADPVRREQLLADAKAELNAAQGVRHPGLGKIHAVFVEGETIVIVQDFIHGVTLESLRGTPLDASAALRMFIAIAHAIAALHRKKIVHRDLKPANIIVDDRLKPTLIDLGLSAIAGSREEGDGPARGTRQYIAPEILVPGERPAPDVRQDIFAFGVMLGEFLPASLGGRAAGRFAFLTRGGPLSKLLAAMTSLDPGRRPATMKEVADALEACRKELAE